MSTAPTAVAIAPIQPRPVKVSIDKLEPRNSKKLTRFQALFVEFYRRGGNAKQAAILAGYSPLVAEHASSTILQHPKVQEEIARRDAEYFESIGLGDPNTVIRQIFLIANANISDYLDDNGHVDVKLASRSQMYAVKSISYDPLGRPRLELESKSKALETLLKAFIVKSEQEKNPERQLTLKDFDSFQNIVTNNNIQVNIVSNERKEELSSPALGKSSTVGDLVLGATRDSSQNLLPSE